MSSSKKRSSKNKKRGSKNKHNKKRTSKDNDRNTEIVDVNNKNKRRMCPKSKCECWIRLKKFCEYFKIDHTTVQDNVDLDQIPEKMTHFKKLRKRTNSKVLESDMADLWQHYLYYHHGSHTHAQCNLRSLCLYIKGKGKKENHEYHYRRKSWNLLQTMHVYFYHSNEYIQSRKCSARKHRYIRQKTSYRIRRSNPTNIQSPIRIRNQLNRYNMDIPMSTTTNNNNNTDQNETFQSIVMAQAAEEKPKLGPGYSLSQSHSKRDSNKRDSNKRDSNKRDSNKRNSNKRDSNKRDSNKRDSNKSNKRNSNKRNSKKKHSDDYKIDNDDDDEYDDEDDDDLDIINQATELIPNDYYAIQYQSTTVSVPLRVLEFGSPFIATKNDAKYKNPKDEILNNTFCSINKKEWNDLLKSCIQYGKKKNAKDIGLKLKEIVGLKLYTDFDELQREYRKCYRENQPDRVSRQKQFYHWNYILLTACCKSSDIITDTLYHGVNEAFSTPSYSGTYYGPISTTSIFDIAKQFAGAKGRIFELYPTFGRRGLKVSWLSNFPDEGEVLYMNTSFQIVNLYTSEFKRDTNNNLNHSGNLSEQQLLFEKSILKALHVINTESNVISFSDMQDITPEQDLAFHQLAEPEQISILYLLYLQYTKDWDKFWKKKGNNYKKMAFATYRDQFIVLAKNVKAVKMERLPMLIQHFFYESHKKYKFPFVTGDINAGIENIKQQFIRNQPLRFETITRLFPNTQQLLINGNNFDWTLERLIKFMMKYDLEGVSLQEIQIRFIPQYPGFDEKYEADEQEAATRLTKSKAHKNITKLRKLGWIFETPCHLRRVGFEPLPELPFLLVFIQGDNELFYKTYSMAVLNRSALSSHRARFRNESVTLSTQHEDASFSLDGYNGPPFYRKSMSAIDSRYDRFDGKTRNTGGYLGGKYYRKSIAVTPQDHGGHWNESPMPPVQEGIGYNGSYGGSYGGSYSNMQFRGSNFRGSNFTNLGKLNEEYVGSYHYDDNENDDDNDEKLIDIKMPSIDQSSSASPAQISPKNIPPIIATNNKSPAQSVILAQSQIEGRNPLVLGYNPKNCILNMDVFSKLEYKKDLIDTLFWRLQHPKMKNPTDTVKKKFIKYCFMVQVLVIDPMPSELEKLFTVIPSKKPIISFDNIYLLFPECTDIFLRNTQLNLRIGYRIQNFVKSNPKTKMERIFFCKNIPIRKPEIPQLQEILNPIGFGFQESEQMAVKNMN